MKKLFVILALLKLTLNAQVEYSKGSDNLNLPLFSVDAACYKSDQPGKTKVDFFVQVPYSEIQFVKRNDSYYASYNVTLTFMDKDKNNLLSERIWKEQIIENEFNRTIARNNFNLSYKSYDLKPGEYFFKCTVEDLDSRRTAFREYVFKVDEISDTLGLSNLMLVADTRVDASDEIIIPNVSKIVTNKTDSLQFYFDVYSNKEQQVYIEYILNDIKAKQSTKTLDPRTVKQGRNSVMFTLPETNFKLGDYSLKIVLKDNNWKEITSTEKKFFSKLEGLPGNITDLDKAIDQLLYIATPGERDYISETEDYNLRLERFIEFWNKKKPNPNVDENPILYEYYRRIDYANKNFKGLSEGWRTDMGLIFVTFGPPSSVERHPFDSDSKPYEIWDYYDHNRSFVFIDQTGFGDYRLYNPDFSRWPGYRQ
jgi:GWxTD domain-containing protein